MNGNCKSCVYVVEQLGADKKTKLYNCHRYPPTGFMATVQVAATPANPQGLMQAPGSLWPPVMDGQWCGEYVSKPFKENAPG